MGCGVGYSGQVHSLFSGSVSPVFSSCDVRDFTFQTQTTSHRSHPPGEIPAPSWSSVPCEDDGGSRVARPSDFNFWWRRCHNFKKARVQRAIRLGDGMCMLWPWEDDTACRHGVWFPRGVREGLRV